MYVTLALPIIPSLLVLRTGFSSLFVLPHLRDHLVSSSVWLLPTAFAYPSTSSLHIRWVHSIPFAFAFDVLLLMSAWKAPSLCISPCAPCELLNRLRICLNMFQTRPGSHVRVSCVTHTFCYCKSGWGRGHRALFGIMLSVKLRKWRWLSGQSMRCPFGK
jgi:hypothetical protein